MKCFLSYRRADAEQVARELFLHFQGRFGRGSVFWDHESIPPDRDWQKILRRDVEATDVVVALIGSSWLQILKDRLKSPSPDYVRFELEHAHKCNKPVVIVPVEGASAPRANDLPESLHFLTRLQSPRLDLTHQRQSELDNLERRLIAYGPAATDLALQRLFAADGVMAWQPQGRGMVEESPSWWEQWNFHVPPLVQRLTQIIRRAGEDPNVVVITGRYGSGRRYLAEAAARDVQQQGAPVLYLQLDLDGYETTEHGVLRRFLKHQGTRQGIAPGRELDHLLEILESRFQSPADSLDVCAVCGLLLDMTRSFRQVERFLSRHLDSGRAGGTRSLFMGVLRELSQGQSVVVHAVDQASLVCTLQEDLLFLASQLPRMVL
ncbi:MAG TPA: toll/interleukin-1 receptor domain-containing protein, partial [Gemmataceae bacterium]|nr:toll/interleukin-1 receptor domain-containing protein [Gemmataceae bacterium]